MANIIDYLSTQFAPFEELEFGPVDSLVLSEFCMIELDDILADMPSIALEASPNKKYILPWKKKDGAGLKFSDVMRAEHYHSMFRGFTTQGCKDNLIGLAASPRFRDMTIHSYRSILDHESHIQFAATTFIYKDLFAFIGFRGTDTSIAGWREDFDMSAAFPVPAQDEALHFLKQTVARLPKKIKHIYVGGHSKGANLAVYASIFAPPEIQARITRVFDHDGPGFRNGCIPADSPIIERIHKTVPHDSIVGVIMNSPSPYHAIESTEKGLMQHDPFSWVIRDNDFVYMDDISDSCRLFGKVTQHIVQHESPQELQALVDLLFNVLDAAGVDMIPEITSDWKKTIPLMVQAASSTDKEERDTAIHAVKFLTDAFLAEMRTK